jgi:mRNA interferase MazF
MIEMNKNIKIVRGCIYLMDFGDKNGHLQAGFRPGLVISNSLCNRFSPVLIVIPLSTKKSKHTLPVHISITEKDLEKGVLTKESVVHCEQIQSINRSSIHRCVGKISNDKIRHIENTLLLSVGIEQRQEVV